jgi:hypothetical protein
MAAGSGNGGSLGCGGASAIFLPSINEALSTATVRSSPSSSSLVWELFSFFAGGG